MPTYEYICDKCGLHFEKFQLMADQPLKTCPKELCGQKRWGKGKVKKQISMGAGLIFKGSGFYITDYRSEGYKAAAKKDDFASSGSGGGSKPAASGGETKTPAKTEAKSESKATPAPAKPAKPAKSKE